MAKIPFSIKYRPQIESGEYKVETKDYHHVRIICWNKNSGGLDRIVALVAGDSGQEKTLHYTEEGLCVATGNNRDKDLFIVTPEPELSAFEKAIRDLVLDIDEGELQKLGVFEEENLGAWAVKKATELLNLARKEVMDGWSKGLRDTQDLSEKAYNEGYNLGFETGYEQGKAEALKDLPRWEKQMYAPQEVNIYLPTNELVYHGMAISINDLTKLPGFKEDESHE